MRLCKNARDHREAHQPKPQPRQVTHLSPASSAHAQLSAQLSTDTVVEMWVPYPTRLKHVGLWKVERSMGLELQAISLNHSNRHVPGRSAPVLHDQRRCNNGSKRWEVRSPVEQAPSNCGWRMPQSYPLQITLRPRRKHRRALQEQKKSQTRRGRTTSDQPVPTDQFSHH